MERFFLRLGVATFALGGFFGSAECGLRVFDRVVEGVPFAANKGEMFYTLHPYLFRVPKPGFEYQGVRINQQGFRGPELASPKPRDTFRVLALGGSAVWNPYVSNNDQTWAVKLQANLNRAMQAQGNGLTFEVINGGVPGYTSAESLMNLVWRGLPLEPDAVLVYQGYNDFKPNRWPGFRPDYSHWRAKDHSQFRHLSRQVRVVWYAHTLLAGFSYSKLEKQDTVEQPGLDAFAANLGRIVTLARAEGAQPLLATYAMSVTPARVAQDPARFRRVQRALVTLSVPEGLLDAHRRYNEAVTTVGRELDVPVIAVEGRIPKDNEHFVDHCHFTDHGTTVVADLLARDLLEELSYPGKPAAVRGDHEP